MRDGPVVVGLNYFDSSRTTLALAAEEAALRQTRLRVVHVIAMAGPVLPPAPMPVDEPDSHRAAAILLENAAEDVRRGYPGLDVQTESFTDAVVPALLRASEEAQLLVVGLNSGFVRHVLGSTADAVSRHASCPVLVAHPRDDADHVTGEIVVGVDGSDVAVRAVDFALEEASRRGVGVTAVHAVPVPVLSTSEAGPVFVVDADTESHERLVLTDALTPGQERYPDVAVTPRLVQGSPGRVLAEYSRHARLVVVGSRGGGGFRALLLGSTSYTVLHASTCPVAVVPASR